MTPLTPQYCTVAKDDPEDDPPAVAVEVTPLVPVSPSSGIALTLPVSQPA